VRSNTISTPAGTARERLLTAALDRFAADTPVAVSLEEIRRDAGVSVGALYHHFADKAALVDELYIQLTAQFQAEFLSRLRGQATAEAGIKSGVSLYLRWVTRNPAGARLLLAHRPTDPRLTELNRAFLTELKSWWSTHQHYGALRALPLDLAHALWFGPAHEYTRQWLDRSRRRTPASTTDLLAEAAWETLKEPA
jgi:AcrR family transcriptional regulator